MLKYFNASMEVDNFFALTYSKCNTVWHIVMAGEKHDSIHI